MLQGEYINYAVRADPEALLASQKKKVFDPSGDPLQGLPEEQEA